MKRLASFACFAATLVVVSCGTSRYTEMTSPEESGLNLMKITDENSNTVGGCRFFDGIRTPLNEWLGRCTEGRATWTVGRYLAISPDGEELAYVSRINDQWNIMVRRARAQGASTQRTFRSVGDFSWGSDNKLYFGDVTSSNTSQISAMDSHAGTIMRQLTSNNYDSNPVLSLDGKTLYFTRHDQSGPFVWSYELETGALTACCKGFNPWPVGENEFLCVRNSNSVDFNRGTRSSSEIWLVNYMDGKETLIISDKKRGFTNPVLSPDGKWILCQGNSKSSITKGVNLDIFAIKTDGSQFIQLTYHPADDCCPVWSPDGKYIYFISTRANKEKAYNIWKMKFTL